MIFEKNLSSGAGREAVVMEAKPKINQTDAIFTVQMWQKLNFATFYVESTIFGMSSQVVPRKCDISNNCQCILHLIASDK